MPEPPTLVSGSAEPAATPVPLRLDQYRDAVGLDSPGRPEFPTVDPERAASELVGLLLADPVLQPLAPGIAARHGEAGDRALLRALLTVRPPGPLPDGVEPLLDRLLTTEQRGRPVTDPESLPSIREEFPGTSYPAADATSLWRGDITSLAADAIVNAANDQLLGCFLPFHACIDNVIHAVAGPQLREDCHTIVTLQDGREPTGVAKITRGHHLPARYVLHTVGPIVADHDPSPAQAAQLAGCYRSCLDVAAEVDGVRTVAFCSISTGVFGYPKPAAASIALSVVAEWIAAHPGRLDRIVFNVFSADDHATYAAELSR